jgi:solute carrier family 5 (high affinity choline transporter), member 7
MALAAILTMYTAFLAAGWLAARKTREGSVADLLVAGRAMPVWLATLTMTATWVDGGYLLGTAEGTYKASLASGLQGGLCFGFSLILGGLLFARRMRALEFTTLIDLFETRFGGRWAVVLFVPALLGELFWSAELLVAIGSTLGVMLRMPLTWAIALSAAVVIAYTMAGGMWSVAYTDAIQLGLVVLGLLAAMPFVFEAAGGLSAAWSDYAAARGVRLLPPMQPDAVFPSREAIVNWWDVSAMLVFGGIPWNCYFQRVLSCQTPRKAQLHSLFAGALTIALTIPPLLLGVAAFSYEWPAELRAELQAEPARTLPMLFQHVAPPLVALLGFGAVIGAVTSSFSSSLLSAASMLSWNGYARLLRPDLNAQEMKRVIRLAIGLLGAAAAAMALNVRSVQALWFFTSDLVFVLLFPQLLFALFDPRANRTGSIAAFSVSLVLRLGGGEPLFGIPAFIPYPELLTANPAAWYAGGAMLFPFKTLAAATGLLLLPLVSRLTARWDPPQSRLPNPASVTVAPDDGAEARP